MTNEIWTLLKLLKWTTRYFEEKSIENPRLNVENLLCKTLDLSRVDLYLNYERILSSSELSDFKAMIKRRVNGEPLQYILGETSFYGLPIKLNPAVLIPRPETELLVENIIDTMKSAKGEVIADIGTGSGCIAIALAKNLPEAKIIATDVSIDALAIAQENAELNCVSDQIEFINQDINTALLPNGFSPRCIVSNPPYVSIEEYAKLQKEIVEYEPKAAVTDNKDGMFFYRQILKMAPACLEKGPGPGYLFLELGYGRAAAVVEEAEQRGYTEIEILPDYAKIERIFKAKYEKTK